MRPAPVRLRLSDPPEAYRRDETLRSLRAPCATLCSPPPQSSTLYSLPPALRDVARFRKAREAARSADGGALLCRLMLCRLMLCPTRITSAPFRLRHLPPLCGGTETIVASVMVERP